MKEQHSQSDSPSWLIPLFSFIGGFLVAMAMFSPVLSPDYQRGHSDGYKAGVADGGRNAKQAYEAGVKVGKAVMASP